MNPFCSRLTRKHKAICFSVLFVLFVALSPAAAQQPRIGGFLQLDKRYSVRNDTVSQVDFFNRLRLEFSAPVNENVSAFSSLDFRFYDLPGVRSLVDMQTINNISPVDFSIWEAFVDVSGFLFDNLDLRIGKQRLAWGAADQLNPTDNLNPDDFSDLVNFTEKIPTWAVKGSFYINRFTLTTVWLPGFTPVLLPKNAASLFFGEVPLEVRDQVKLPSASLQNSMYAIKLSSQVGKVDYTFSYFRGYDDIPILQQVNLGYQSGFINPTDLKFGFPGIQVLGADFATELFGIGLWGEMGMFWPEKVVTKIVLGNVTSSDVALDDESYLKFTFGGDYTFPGGLYLNTQWMHGFFTERGSKFLHDYFIVRVDKTILKNKIKISLGGGLEIAEWRQLDKNYGVGFFPEVIYQSIDNLELAAGVFIVDGKSPALFGAWKDADQAYLRAKLFF